MGRKKKTVIAPYSPSIPTKVRMNEVIQTELVSIREKMGVLTAENVVEVAKNKKNPLHRFFEWDDKKAATGYRLIQARWIIDRVKIQVSPDGVSMPAWVSVKSGNSGEPRVYRPIKEVMEDTAATERYLETAVRHLETWTLKFNTIKHMTEFKAISEATKSLREKMEAEKQKSKDSNDEVK